jgi:opine dehydrogenase
MAEEILEEKYKMRKKKYTVIGAGNGGLVTAGYIFLKGYKVSLYNRTEKRIKHIRENGYNLEFGNLISKIKPDYVGTNLSTAVLNGDVIIIVITADGHEDIAKKIAPYLTDGQIILLVPGRTCGVLLFSQTLNRAGCKANVIIAEANTLFFAARLSESCMIKVKGVKINVSVSALHSCDTDYIINILSEVFPNLTKADSFLDTSFSNIGAIFHPTIFLVNKERIIRKEKFNFYTDGVTKQVAEYIEKVDFEFQSISTAIGVNSLSVRDWLNSRYGLPQSTIYKMIKFNPTYKNILAPTTINHRYICGDIPTGLVPMSLFGKALGVPTPTIDYFIEQGSKLLDTDFRSEGRTLSKLGLSTDNLISDLWDATVKKKLQIESTNKSRDLI